MTIALLLSMKFFCLLLCPLWLFSSSLAQTPSTATGILRYNESLGLSDTTKRTSIPQELRFSQTESVTHQLGSIRGMPIQDSLRLIRMGIKEDTTKRNVVYKNLQSNRMVSRQKADNELVIVDDSMSPIDWTIHPDTRRFGKLKAQRATTFTRGRHYTAWFCPQIPISTGPWKLYGLPGLILEAYDATGEVRFEFVALQIPAPSGILIEPPRLKLNKPSLTEQVFLKRRKENAINFERMVNSMSENANGKVRFTVKGIEIYSEN